MVALTRSVPSVCDLVCGGADPVCTVCVCVCSQLDLALVYRDLYGGACSGAVEALRRDEPLPAPILAVFQHDLTQRYLAPGQCTLLAGRPWQIIKDIRSPPPPPQTPPPDAAQAASVTGTGTSLSFKEPA